MGYGESRMHLNYNIQCRVICVHISGVGKGIEIGDWIPPQLRSARVVEIRYLIGKSSTNNRCHDAFPYEKATYPSLVSEA